VSTKKLSGPAKGNSFLANAKDRWGAKMPEWIGVLARAADAEAAKGGSLRTLGQRVSASASMLSACINNSYNGSYDRIEAKVRGVLMNEQVDCPALGHAISRAACANNQALKPSTAGPHRMKLTRMCPRCPNFLGGNRS
jgi:hypothetical protein